MRSGLILRILLSSPTKVSPVEGDNTSKATIKAKRSVISYLEATEITDTNNSLCRTLLYGSVLQRLGTTEFTDLIG